MDKVDEEFQIRLNEKRGTFYNEMKNHLKKNIEKPVIVIGSKDTIAEINDRKRYEKLQENKNKSSNSNSSQILPTQMQTQSIKKSENDNKEIKDFFHYNSRIKTKSFDCRGSFVSPFQKNLEEKKRNKKEIEAKMQNGNYNYKSSNIDFKESLRTKSLNKEIFEVINNKKNLNFEDFEHNQNENDYGPNGNL